MAADEEFVAQEDQLAKIVSRYEELLATGESGSDLDLNAIRHDPALWNRWQESKNCLDFVYRVRHQTASRQIDFSASLIGPGGSLPAELSVPRFLGSFEIIRLLGAGGIGLVYLARDRRLGRLIALKVPRLETLTHDDLRMRFLREAEAAARLSHPNVVSVLETGQQDLLCYIAVEYCPGPTLAQWLHAHGGTVPGTVPIRTAATLVRHLSAAVQHAHSRGVLHRDIKPGNILLIEPPEGNDTLAVSGESAMIPKLTDFGLAKLQEAKGEETRSGVTIGTPNYMAPEQAAGRVREIDSRTDVYALGAVLYELLVGVPPLCGDTPVETFRKVLDEDPTPPHRLRPEVPIDLDAICLKCLAKRPADRYQTAQQLTDDFDRYFEGEAILARSPTRIEGLRKWASRHPLLLGALTVISFSLLALMTVISVYSTRLSKQIIRADAEAEANRRLIYAANVHSAQQSLWRNNVAHTRELLAACIPKSDQSDLREFSWHYVLAACDRQALTLRGHQGDVFAVAFSPDGTTIASAGKDRTVRLWDSQTGELRRTLLGHKSEITSLAFHPAGELLVTGSEDGTVRVWQWATGSEQQVIPMEAGHVLAVTYSANGRLLAAGSRKGLVRVWKVEDLSQQMQCSLDPWPANVLHFANNDATLLVGDEEGRLHNWDVHGAVRRSIITRPLERYFALSVNADSTVVATAGRTEDIEFYVDSAGKLIPDGRIADAHIGWIQSLAFSPLTNVLASGGKDGVVRLWSAATRRLTHAYKGHNGRIWSVAWSPDGQRLASASGDGEIRVWDSSPVNHHEYASEKPRIRGFALTADQAILAYREDGCINRYSPGEKHPRTIRKLNTSQFHVAAFSHDQSRIVLLNYDHQVEMRSFPDFEKVWQNKLGKLEVGCFSPNDDRIAIAFSSRSVAILDADTGAVLQQFEVEDTVRDCMFLSNGNLVVATRSNLTCWQPHESTLMWTIAGTYHHLTVSPDSQYVIAKQEHQLLIAEADTGEPAYRIVAEGEVLSLAVSPDCRTLAAGIEQPRQIECWDLQTGRELITIATPDKQIVELQFSPEGNRLVALADLNQDRTCQFLVWSVSALQPKSAPRQPVVISPDESNLRADAF